MSATVTAVPTGTWNVDPSHSVVEFQVKHMGIATVKGQFADFAGSLTIAPDGSATASGTVEAASVNTHNADRDGHIKSAEFFDVENTPQISFTSTEITQVSDDSFKITGDLTMHGITKPVTLDATFEGTDVDPWGNERVALSVTGQVSRSEYDMRWNQALGSGNVLVSDKVKISLELSAVKAA